MNTGEHDVTFAIAELARRTGMTVRNIRAHQARGLLPPAARRGRTLCFGEEHVDRLRLIRHLQAAGFNLTAIAALLRDGEGTPAYVLALRREAVATWGADDPVVLDRAQLAALFGATGAEDPQARIAAMRAAFVEELGDGRYRLPSEAVARAAARVIALGIPARDVVVVQESVLRHSEDIAHAFVGLCLEHAWQPFAAEGYPPERWPQVRETCQALEPAVADVLLTTFRLAMNQAATEVLRGGKPRPQPRTERRRVTRRPARVRRPHRMQRRR